MNFVHRCPACGEIIPRDRIFSAMMICSCGWTLSLQSQNAEKKIASKISSFIFMGTLVILAVFLQVVHWDKYFFTIIPLKIKENAGWAQATDLKKIIEICQERHKSHCLLKAYQELYKINQDTKVLAQLGELQYQLGETGEALFTFQKYLSSGGTDHRIGYHYAQILSQTGRFTEASYQYRRLLAQRPNILQISIIRSYVSMLMSNRQYKEARNILTSYRKKSQNAGYFMEKEYQALNRILGTPTNEKS